jgi:hypothetical protein
VNPPANTAAPIHTGDTVQEKQGGIWSKKVLVSPVSIFKKSMFLPGNKSVLRIGSDDTGSGTQSFTKGSAGAITQDFNTALFGETDSIPLVIDLHDRAKPRDAIEFITNQACPIVTRFTNDKAAAFEFKKGTGRANIIARQVQLTGGDPDANDVLVSDAQGNARWAKASVNANGVVVFSSGTSPVPAGQTCVVPPNNPTNPDPTCPTGQNWNGTQCICSNTGNTPLTPPTGNGPVATKKINTQVCTTITGVAGGTDCEDSSADPLIPPYALLEQGRASNGGPGNACVIINTVPPFDACPADDDVVGEPSITDYNTGTVYPLGSSGQAGKWQIVSSLGDSCRFNENNISNPGAPAGSTTSRSTLYTIQSNP